VVNITTEIVQRLSDLGFECYDNNMRAAIAYFIRQNFINILGTDNYNEEDIDIVKVGKSLSISPSDANSFNVSVRDGKLVASSDKFLFSISKYGDKIINDRVVDNIDYRYVASENEYALMKYIDSNLVSDVRAKNLGSFKTGKQLFQFIQNVPKDGKNDSFLYKLQRFVTNDDVMSFDSNINEDNGINIEKIFEQLKYKYRDVLNEDKNKTR